jgi:threonylcarbamoyladenosine tRNA methylthiotransferase MtaB
VKKVFIKTMGCKVNAHDSHSLRMQFMQQGYELVDDQSKAQISLLNTCSVTEKAGSEGRYLVRRFRKDNPESLIVATGCYAQTHSAELKKMNELDFIVPNEAKNDLVSLVEGVMTKKEQDPTAEIDKLPQGINEVEDNRQSQFKTSIALTQAESDQTRAYVKIQDGCDGFCSYCLIPYARGKSRSIPSDVVLAEIKRLISSGVNEIVLTGIHIGDYGEDIPGAGQLRFSGLVKEILGWKDMCRLRISSLEPGELDEDLLKALLERSDIACDHFHLPLQSGHNRILKLMRRSYDKEEYADKVAMIRQYFPDANIGADVIPGFPSESEEEFAATEQYVKDLALNYLHVFPYSKRPNTAAYRMPGHLAPEIVKARTRSLIALSRRLKLSYYQRFIGKTMQVLWEGHVDAQGRRLGKTANYLDVVCSKSGDVRPNTISTVHLRGMVGEQILGTEAQ